MKKEISWKDLVKKTADKHKKSGTFDFKNVLADAGKEWEDIKSGKHAEYIQGKSVAAAGTRKNKKVSKSVSVSKSKSISVSKSKSKSKSKKDNEMSQHSDCDAEMILSKNILCKSCTGKVQKLMKKQSGGNLSPAEYQASAVPQSSQAPLGAGQAQAQAPLGAGNVPNGAAPAVHNEVKQSK